MSKFEPGETLLDVLVMMCDPFLCDANPWRRGRGILSRAEIAATLREAADWYETDPRRAVVQFKAIEPSDEVLGELFAEDLEADDPEAVLARHDL